MFRLSVEKSTDISLFAAEISAANALKFELVAPLTTKIRSAEFSTDESNFGLVGNLTAKLPLPVLWIQRIKKMDFSCFDDFFSCFAHDSTDDRKIGKSGMFTYRLTVVKRIRFPRPTPSRRFFLPLAFAPCFRQFCRKCENLHPVPRHPHQQNTAHSSQNCPESHF